MKRTIEVMIDQSEVIHYEHPGVPLQIRTMKLSDYLDYRVLCHWHDDIEFLHIVSGKMNYYVNGCQIQLNENDSLMVNTRQLHYADDVMKQECVHSYILFHPTLFVSNRVLFDNCILPLLKNRRVEYIYFDSRNTFGSKMSEMIRQLVDMKESKEPSYEMKAIGIMHILWGEIMNNIKVFPENENENSYDDLKAQKDMVSFIHQHYAEKISLEDIAASGHVCRNKCCILFKRYLQQSPIDFLNAYRLQTSCDFLAGTDMSITEVAFSCGFNHLSYFSKIFAEKYQCTPGEYRRAKEKGIGSKNG